MTAPDDAALTARYLRPERPRLAECMTIVTGSPVPPETFTESPFWLAWWFENLADGGRATVLRFVAQLAVVVLPQHITRSEPSSAQLDVSRIDSWTVSLSMPSTTATTPRHAST